MSEGLRILGVLALVGVVLAMGVYAALLVEGHRRSSFEARLTARTDDLLRKARAIGPERATMQAQYAKLLEETTEVADAIAAQDDNVLAELADVVIVSLALARLEGYDVSDLMVEVDRKTKINSLRTWHADDRGSIHHD